MTTKPKTRKAPTKTRRSKVCTIEEAATIDFEPYPMSGKVPELKDFEPHLIASRMSFALMHKSKNELVKAFTSEPDLMMKLIEELAISMKFFKAPRRRTSALHAGAVLAASWMKLWHGVMPGMRRGGRRAREGDIEIDFCAIIPKFSGAG
jgi:hypothetical protein